MLFQVIDDKSECVGLYYDSRCVFENLDFSKLTRTWRPTQTSLEHGHIEYAWLRCHGRSLQEVCPDSLRPDLDLALERMGAFSKALKAAKVNVSENCIFEILPPKEFSRFLEIKNRITEHVFLNFEKPKDYGHLLDTYKVLEEIKHRKINIDFSELRRDSYREKNRKFLDLLKSAKKCVSYNLFGTKTGRLTVDRGFFPILTLDRDLRKYVKPNNDFFVEIDFNGAEIRTLLALLEKEQPEVDIHEWNAENVYRGLVTREEAKKRFFSWLYNPASDDYLSSRTYNRDAIKEKFWDGEKVKTPFNREIYSDEYHCINYTLQSVSNDICLEQAKKVYNLLKDKKSKISFLMHDSIILDSSLEDKDDIKNVFEIFQKTRFGKYMANIKVGKNFGEMRDLNWKL